MYKKLLVASLILANFSGLFSMNKQITPVSDEKLIELSKGYFFGANKFKRELKMVQEVRGGIKKKTKEEILKTSNSYKKFSWTLHERFGYWNFGLSVLGVAATLVFSPFVFACDDYKDKIACLAVPATIWTAYGSLHAMRQIDYMNSDQVWAIRNAVKDTTILSDID